MQKETILAILALTILITLIIAIMVFITTLLNFLSLEQAFDLLQP
jgi:hypothetical protein